MEGLFIEYKDPLFGIILFFALVFTVAFFSYWWGHYKSKEDEKSIDKFIKGFHSLPTEKELDNLLQTPALSYKSMHLLATTYFQHGDYEKSIEIYAALLEKKLSVDSRKETMLLLGQTYLKAGFLERSKKLFLEILSHHPRTPSALQFLLVIYERMRDFDKAKEILEPLDEMDLEIAKDAMYLTIISMQFDPTLHSDKKVEKIIAWQKTNHQLAYMIFEYLFKHAPQLAWKNLDQSLCPRIADILWDLEPRHLDLDIIASNSFLRELYSAKGVINTAQQSSVFELDVLINLRAANYQGADLQFEYLCGACKQVFPFSFHRCPNCLQIDTLRNEMLLTKAAFEANLSFQ
ncbi:MAG: tetratricopeptide repeat protein [Campylobacterales bacterium]|nr:tetratricopeptide repeat protein [Campylobacterales bacterium]